eukprot:TRINITY_DN6824_c0_g2_i1.p1 TRINITY_DN6824_c0_g2~~TRINITY_DN6824_c0_g2_i1.p1  ORF type:complete len:591 (+),score=89.70 TRINITY_DN6824_c0_g2_i1:179-1774(+)
MATGSGRPRRRAPLVLTTTGAPPPRTASPPASTNPPTRYPRPALVRPHADPGPPRWQAPENAAHMKAAAEWLARVGESLASMAGNESALPVGDIPVRWAKDAKLALAFVSAQTARLGADAPRWHEGTADRPLPGLDLGTGGVIAVLYEPSDVYVWRLLRSLCTLLAAPHPLLLFWTDYPAPDDTRRAVTAAATSRKCFRRQVWFVELVDELWREVQNPSHEKGDATLHQMLDYAPVPSTRADGLKNLPRTDFAHGEGYRRMCWFWHRTIHWLPCLREVPLVMRLDTDSELISAPPRDPIRAVAAANASYAYNSFCFDNPQFTRGLWNVLRLYTDAQPHLGTPRWPGFCLPDPAECIDLSMSGAQTEAQETKLRQEMLKGGLLGDFVTASLLDACPVPMFYTNFEVMRSSFFRQPEVDRWLRSLRRGVLERRWGDAPLRALTLGLFASPEDVLFLDDFDYRHGREDARTLHKGHGMRLHWKMRPQGAKDEDDTFWLGVCLKRPSRARPVSPGELASRTGCWKYPSTANISSH